jgi:hypothetical protein
MRVAPAASLTAAVLAVSSCSINVDHEGYIEREEKRFPATSMVSLHLYTFDGSIEVRSWDKPEVLVEVEKRGEDKEAVAKIQVLSERNGERIQVEARHPAGRTTWVGFGSHRAPSARLIATLPRSQSSSMGRRQRGRRARGRPA